MADNPTFARHGDSTVNFQFVGSYGKKDDTKIEIIFGTGRVDIWEFDTEDDRNDAMDKLDSLYTDVI